MGSTRILRALLVKDLRCIWGSPNLLVSTFGFSLLLVIVASFAFRQIGYGQEELKAVTPGILWMVFLFTGILGLNHSFLPEYENQSLLGITLAPIDLSHIFLAKTLSNFLFISLVHIFAMTAHTVFFGAEIFPLFPQLVFITLVFNIGFISLGTLLSAISVLLKEREIILPLLLFPLLIPPIAGAVYMSRELLQSNALAYGDFWFTLVWVFGLVSFVLSWVLFEYVVRD